MKTTNVNKALNIIHIFLIVVMIATIIGLFFNKEIYAYRINAVFSILGANIIIGGIHALLNKKFEYAFLNKITREKTLINQTGEKAQRTGCLLIILGVVLLSWGAVTFWIPFISNNF
jgi:hypothetical protein